MFFPTLKGKKFGYVNLDTEARKWMAARKSKAASGNSLLDPATCEKMVTAVHKKYSLDYSYGGWMEDRTFLLRGSYLEKERNFIHLGVDFNVPTGTPVAVPFSLEVVSIDDDYPEEGGWGPRLIGRHIDRGVYFIIAHLDRDIRAKIGEKLEPGQVFATAGKAPFNGNWFPHVHVQTISADYYDELEKGNAWHELDGYGLESELTLNAQRFGDPISFL